MTVIVIVMCIHVLATLALYILHISDEIAQRKRMDRLTETCRERDRSIGQRVKRLENWRRAVILHTDPQRREAP